MKNNYHYDLNIVKQFFKYDYRDRGMLKWKGFYLSDHTAALKKTANTAKAHEHVKVHAQQSLADISEILAKSFAEQRLVQLQLNILNKNDQFTQDITGFVTGFNTDSIWLTGQDFPIQIQDIRHITIS